MKARSIVGVLGLFVGWLSGIDCAMAQVIPDGSLPTTVTSPDALNFTIDNGARSGGNLFHSFSQLSVPTGGSAFFNNALDVQNIFARVTGGNASNIDGLLRANGTASLFLLNPNGILFGPNASLNLGGSFIGTTASGIQFADGTVFSATNPSSPPLLTISAPIGLQMGQNPGRITVEGLGHNIINGYFTPLDRSQNPTGLQVKANNTLALIGNEVSFSGGIVVANGGGHLEIGSVQQGQVGLNATLTGWVGDYSQIQQFNNIHLAQKSMLDASGSNGSIQVQGKNISLSEGSTLLLQNLGAESKGITLQATETLNLTGSIPEKRLGSWIRIENLGIGSSGDIVVSANQLSVQDGGRIETVSFSPANGGNVTIDVQESLDLNGFILADPGVTSLIGTTTINSGKAGNLNISSDKLRIFNGAGINSLTFAAGDTGAMQINAKDLIEIVGNNPFILSPSSISSTTTGTGNADSIVVNTSRLIVRDGGGLGSSTLYQGGSGSVRINASDYIEVRGKATGSIISSSIASSSEILDPITQAIIGVPPIPTGDAGALTINTPALRIFDGAFISVKNDGPGKAGDIQINANSVFLNNQGSISASTASGNGGNINLNLQDYLLMRYGSLIAATAQGDGDGGNLLINAPIIVGLENSDIVANAVEGRGGNINISTQGIIGLKFRDTLTPRTDLTNDITASSERNINGSVEVNNVGVDPNSGLVELSTTLIDSTQQVAAGCSGTQGSSFVITGRGGVPQNPAQEVTHDRTWNDLRDLSAYRGQSNTIAAKPTTQPVLVQASGFQRKADGSIALIASPTPVTTLTIATCSQGAKMAAMAYP